MTFNSHRHTLLLTPLLTVLVACGSQPGSKPDPGADDGSAGSGGSASGNGGTGGGGNNESLLGDDPAVYAEGDSGVEGVHRGGEPTGIRLDSSGLRITGAFDDADDAADYYVFNTGDYERLDVRTFVGGVRQEQANSDVSISLDAVADDGYSAITGRGYFTGAYLVSGKQYEFSISALLDASVAGRAYVIEIKGRE
jgi:hypothetical protein